MTVVRPLSPSLAVAPSRASLPERGAGRRFSQMTVARPLSKKVLDSGRWADICKKLGASSSRMFAGRPSGGNGPGTGRVASK